MGHAHNSYFFKKSDSSLTVERIREAGFLAQEHSVGEEKVVECSPYFSFMQKTKEQVTDKDIKEHMISFLSYIFNSFRSDSTKLIHFSATDSGDDTFVAVYDNKDSSTGFNFHFWNERSVKATQHTCINKKKAKIDLSDDFKNVFSISDVFKYYSIPFDSNILNYAARYGEEDLETEEQKEYLRNLRKKEWMADYENWLEEFNLLDEKEKNTYFYIFKSERYDESLISDKLKETLKKYKKKDGCGDFIDYYLFDELPYFLTP